LEGAAASVASAERAYEAAAAGIDAYHRTGTAWPSGAHGGATPCLFLGLAGIGRFYLRLADASIPSLLLVRPEALPRAYGRTVAAALTGAKKTHRVASG
jgi:hypothetical protein